MKVVHYRRHQPSGRHIHWFSDADLFYIPDLGAILFREGTTTFSPDSFGVTREARLLEEALAVEAGRLPAGGSEAPPGEWDNKAVSIRAVRTFEWDGERLRQLVASAGERDRLEAALREGLQSLLHEARREENRPGRSTGAAGPGSSTQKLDEARGAVEG